MTTRTSRRGGAGLTRRAALAAAGSTGLLWLLGSGERKEGTPQPPESAAAAPRTSLPASETAATQPVSLNPASQAATTPSAQPMSPESSDPVIHPIRPDGIVVPKFGSIATTSVVPMASYVGPNKWLGGKPSLQYGIPPNLTQVSWWSADQNGSAAPLLGGSVGNANIAVFWAHTSIDDIRGVFAQLETLQPGDVIYIQGRDLAGKRGTMTLRVIVPAVLTDKTKPEQLDAALSAAPAATRAAFGTCAGTVSADLRSHQQNAWVFADIVAWAPEG